MSRTYLSKEKKMEYIVLYIFLRFLFFSALSNINKNNDMKRNRDFKQKKLLQKKIKIQNVFV
jgi:hypothetical protein